MARWAVTNHRVPYRFCTSYADNVLLYAFGTGDVKSYTIEVSEQTRVIASIESNFIMDDVRYHINSCFFPSLLVIFSYSPYARESGSESGRKGLPYSLVPSFLQNLPRATNPCRLRLLKQPRRRSLKGCYIQFPHHYAQ